MRDSTTRYLIAGVVLVLVVAVALLVRGSRSSSLPAGLPADALSVARERGLTPDDIFGAFYVRADDLQTPMGGRVLALPSQEQAEAEAKRLNGKVLRFEEVRKELLGN